MKAMKKDLAGVSPVIAVILRLECLTPRSSGHSMRAVIAAGSTGYRPTITALSVEPSRGSGFVPWPDADVTLRPQCDRW